MESTNFDSITIGTTKPSTAIMKTIVVVVNSSELMSNYAKAWVAEAARKAPLTFNLVGLTADEMLDYTRYLMAKRIECVDGTCKDFRELKNLWAPAWIENVLSKVGEVIDRKCGKRLIPVLNSADKKSLIKFDQALVISDKIRAFEDDLHITQNVMPTSKEGNLDAMSCALIADYVRARFVVQNVASTYISVFAGFTLKDESAFINNYEQQYDDVALITDAFCQHKEYF